MILILIFSGLAFIIAILAMLRAEQVMEHLRNHLFDMNLHTGTKPMERLDESDPPKTGRHSSGFFSDN